MYSCLICWMIHIVFISNSLLAILYLTLALKSSLRSNILKGIYMSRLVPRGRDILGFNMTIRIYECNDF